MLEKLRRWVFGAPKDVNDPHAFHQLSLIALLAWVGLGADGLSSSAYGPDEAFRQLGENTGLAVFLAAATALTVFIISYAYSKLIEHFPSGGGGYVVATQLLGKQWGVISGAALLVDYVLTITVSIASGADAIFSFLPREWAAWKIAVDVLAIVILTILNIRGVKESITSLVPIFMVFVVTHAFLLVAIVGANLTAVPRVTAEVQANVGHTISTLGLFATLRLFLRAYSLGGGTYTGIEAVSNGLGIMREPRVKTAKRTMLLMAVSLAATAGGILICYLLVHAVPVEGKTMNAVLFERFAGSFQVFGLPIGSWFVITALVSEGALLFVAAQAGFLDGPRVMANMAIDSWFPHRFSALSEQLSMKNGVLLMSGASLAALLYTQGDVSRLVVMYSINVFLTFSLSQLGMSLFWIKHREEHKDWLRHLPVHIIGLLLCVTILIVTVMEKFTEGGWITVVVTGILVLFCNLVKWHYGTVVRAIKQLDQDLPAPEDIEGSTEHARAEEYESLPGAPLSRSPADGEPNPNDPVLVLFVSAYGGLGRHALLTVLRMFPGHFKGVVFASIAVVDSDVFKGANQVEALREQAAGHLFRYVRLARSLGLKATSLHAVGTEVPVEAERIGAAMHEKYPKALVVAGQLTFEHDTLWNRFLHNETAYLIHRRLQHAGVPMVVLPVRLNLESGRAERPRPYREAGATA